jgi:hypothetical protein
MANPGVEPKQEKTDWCKETPPRASDTPIIYTYIPVPPRTNDKHYTYRPALSKLLTKN